jgi:hypothetical protein
VVKQLEVGKGTLRQAALLAETPLPVEPTWEVETAEAHLLAGHSWQTEHMCDDNSRAAAMPGQAPTVVEVAAAAAT